MAKATKTEVGTKTHRYTVVPRDLQPGDVVVWAGRTVTDVDRTVVTEEKVTLELTPDEAQFLRDVLYRVGGPTDSRRRHSDDIAEALQRVGVERLDGTDVVEDSAIYFR